MLPTPIAPSNTGFAAVFLDFENVYYFFKNTFFDPPELNDHILEMLRNLRQKLKEAYNLDSIVLNAYADFERLDSSPQSALYLLGVDTKNVLGTDHKNAADMRLCIDVLEVLYTRAEISTFVLVAGDRDYIPVIQHLRRQARRVLGVGFRESVSGDLLLNLGEGQFLDARELLNENTLERLETRRAEQQKLHDEREKRFAEQARGISERARAAQSNAQNASAPNASAQNASAQNASAPNASAQNAPKIEPNLAPGTSHVPGVINGLSGVSGVRDERSLQNAPIVPPLPPQFAEVSRIHDANALACLEIILERVQQLEQTHGTRELWLGPFLRQLTDEMPMLAEFERRNALDDLARSGATLVEKRPGDPHPFSVLLVNFQHPDVWELNP